MVRQIILALFFHIRKTQYYQKQLLDTIKWQHDQVVIYGKHITTKRKVAWYGDSNYAYTYSNVTKHALPWTEDLTNLKGIIEKLTNSNFNSCLLNLYHNGDEGVSWHSDDEEALGENPIIASLSFGAERKFSLKHKTTKETVFVNTRNRQPLRNEKGHSIKLGTLPAENERRYNAKN